MTESDHPNPSPQAGDFTFSKGEWPNMHRAFRSTQENAHKIGSNYDT